MNGKKPNAIKKYWKIISLATVLMLGMAFAVMRQVSFAQAHDDDDSRQTVIIPLGSTGLTFGEGIRTTLTNLGSRRFHTLIKVIDADGAVLKQEPLSLEPGEMRSFAMSRSEVGRSESSVLLRTEVVAQRSDGDGKDLWMTSEVIDWSTGSTRFQAFASACPKWSCTSNHNETMVRDTAPMK